MRIGISAVISASLMACVGESRQEHFEITEDVHRVIIEDGSGEISVQGDSGDSVEVAAVIYGDGAELSREVVGGVLTLSVDCDGVFSCGADLQVLVPHDIALAVDVGSGNVDVLSVDGGVDVSTGSGEVGISDLLGDVRVDTGSGDIVGCGMGSDQAVMSTGSGDVEVCFGAVPGRVDIETGSGDVTLGLPAGTYDVSVDTGSGDVIYDGVDRSSAAQSRVMISTGSGDVRLHASD